MNVFGILRTPEFSDRICKIFGMDPYRVSGIDIRMHVDEDIQVIFTLLPSEEEITDALDAIEEQKNGFIQDEKARLREVVEKVANKDNWEWHTDLWSDFATTDGPEWVGEDDIQGEAEKALWGRE